MSGIFSMTMERAWVAVSLSFAFFPPVAAQYCFTAVDNPYINGPPLRTEWPIMRPTAVNAPVHELVVCDRPRPRRILSVFLSHQFLLAQFSLHTEEIPYWPTPCTLFAFEAYSHSGFQVAIMSFVVT